MDDLTMDVIDVPEHIIKAIMCKRHEWVTRGKNYSTIEDSYYGVCKHCGKSISNNTPLYKFEFKI